jgi:hypothetical protein
VLEDFPLINNRSFFPTSRVRVRDLLNPIVKHAFRGPGKKSCTVDFKASRIACRCDSLNCAMAVYTTSEQ